MVTGAGKCLLRGLGEFRGPVRGTQPERVFRLVELCLVSFATSAIRAGTENENGLNRMLARFITNTAANESLPFFAHPESMEDETRGDSPAVDIGIYLRLDDSAADPPKVTVLEGKRLSLKTGAHRRREYVVGHERGGRAIVCGGIERFKLGLHGRGLCHAGMVGYVQDGALDHWLATVNAWIVELADAVNEGPVWHLSEILDRRSVGPPRRAI